MSKLVKIVEKSVKNINSTYLVPIVIRELMVRYQSAIIVEAGYNIANSIHKGIKFVQNAISK